MTRGVEEHDLASKGGRLGVSDANLVCADVLRDATGLAFGHVGEANRVEQRGFAVIDMAHDRDNGRTRSCLDCGFLSGGSGGVNILRRLLFECDYIRVGAEEPGHFAGEFRIERLVDRGENAARQQARNQILRANV